MYVTKADVHEGLLVLQKPDLGVQNLAFEYIEAPSQPQHKQIRRSKESDRLHCGYYKIVTKW